MKERDRVRSTLRPAGREHGDDVLDVSVVVCAYTERRWELTRAAVQSVLTQRPAPAQVLLVVDHNAELAARARRELAGVSVLESDGAPGLSGARNTALRAVTQPITAFLDDDAEARPGWLASLTEPYGDSDVVATGGSVHPRWPGFRPSWLPPVFDWVVGCSYLGLPDTVAPVRNPIGANMSLRTRPALEVGGFDASLGRSASRPRGCEETELAIRLTASQPAAVVLYVPAATVDHHVEDERLTFRYFLRRCWHEGLSKAAVVRLAGSSAGLERERRHVAVVIPAALLGDMRRLAAGDSGAFMRLTAAIAGLATAMAGYLVGRAGQAGGSRIRGHFGSRRRSPGSGEPALRLRVLYVAGLPRSGSTVLGCVLGKLPRTIFVGELAYFWRRFAEGELCSCGKPLPDCPFWSAVVGKAFGQMTREQAWVLNILEQRVIRHQRILALAPVRWPTRWSKRIQVMLTERDQLYKSIYEVADVESIVDSGKEVTFGSIMARLGRITFSTVHVVRDPRGVAFSWLKQVRSDSEPRDMPRSTAVRTAARWMSSNLFVQVSLKSLSRDYYRVRYEDLVTHPDDITVEISRATSSFPEARGWAGQEILHTSEHHLVGSNPGVRGRLGSDLRLTLDEEWRTQLPRAQQWLVTAVCAGLMAAYDYPLRRGPHRCWHRTS